jgi:hypothetical protein
MRNNGDLVRLWTRTQRMSTNAIKVEVSIEHTLKLAYNKKYKKVVDDIVYLHSLLTALNGGDTYRH